MEFTEYAVLFGRTDTLFRLQQSIRCLSRRFDMPYPTGGYGISGGLPEQKVDFVPSCYEIFDLEPLSFDFEFLRSFNLASSLVDHHSHTSFGSHLEEIHVTWTQEFGRHLGRNGTRLPLYTKMIKMWHTVCGDSITIPCDDVKVFKRRRQDL
ncbi:hypothetical protein Tco_0685537 [Tanacetum coccineum]